MIEKNVTMYYSNDNKLSSLDRNDIIHYEKLVSLLPSIQNEFNEAFKNSKWDFLLVIENNKYSKYKRLEYRVGSKKDSFIKPDEELCENESKIIKDIENKFSVELISASIYYWCK